MAQKVLQIALNPNHFFGVENGVTPEEVRRMFTAVGEELTLEIEERYPNGTWKIELDFADEEGIEKISSSLRMEIRKVVILRMAERFACIVNGRPPKRSQQTWIEDAMKRAKQRLRGSTNRR